MITDGKTTTVSGFGHLLETFIRSKQLSGYAGQNENVAVLSDDNYATSNLKLMCFDQTFENMPYDASKHKYVFHLAAIKSQNKWFIYHISRLPSNVAYHFITMSSPFNIRSNVWSYCQHDFEEEKG